MIEQHRRLQVGWYCNLSLASDLVAIHSPWNLRCARNDEEETSRGSSVIISAEAVTLQWEFE
ncbi:hypothetical protein ABIB00_004984 [Bradyrhizobium sp. LB14.3]|uniref:hypothetical protein n=1 Tax=Bradyrhizobium sp. LB14.3 TaxID=3156328 RepID=UPI003399B9B7